MGIHLRYHRKTGYHDCHSVEKTLRIHGVTLSSCRAVQTARIAFSFKCIRKNIHWNFGCNIWQSSSFCNRAECYCFHFYFCFCSIYVRIICARWPHIVQPTYNLNNTHKYQKVCFSWQSISTIFGIIPTYLQLTISWNGESKYSLHKYVFKRIFDKLSNGIQVDKFCTCGSIVIDV